MALVRAEATFRIFHAKAVDEQKVKLRPNELRYSLVHTNVTYA